MKLHRLRAFLPVLLLFAVLLSGCGSKEGEKTEVPKAAVLFTYGDIDVTAGEVYIYANTVKERYELQYGENVWNLSVPSAEDPSVSVPMEEELMKAVVREIVKVKTLSNRAVEQLVELTPEEKETLAAKSAEFYKGLTDQDIRDMELSEELVYRVFYENMIADRMQEKILADHPVEISDEEARMTRFYDLYFPCYYVNAEDDVVTPYTEEGRKMQYENALAACGTLGTGSFPDNGEDGIESLAKLYRLELAGEKIMKPEEILEAYDRTVYDLLYSMENGEFSTVVETEYGYHIFEMRELTDRAATDERKEAIREETVNALMSETLAEWQQTMDPEFSYPDSVDMELLRTVMETAQ